MTTGGTSRGGTYKPKAKPKRPANDANFKGGTKWSSNPGAAAAYKPKPKPKKVSLSLKGRDVFGKGTKALKAWRGMDQGTRKSIRRGGVANMVRSVKGRG
jgi:hypothetical protein